VANDVVDLDKGSGMDKKSRSGSGMNIPDHSSESLDTIFWVKKLKFFDAVNEKFGSCIWEENW
jgi:hypothetical protein